MEIENDINPQFFFQFSKHTTYYLYINLLVGKWCNILSDKKIPACQCHLKMGVAPCKCLAKFPHGEKIQPPFLLMCKPMCDSVISGFSMAWIVMAHLMMMRKRRKMDTQCWLACIVLARFRNWVPKIGSCKIFGRPNF